ncbi:MAG TPA: 4-hydroxy-tetrahydrodipicolinate synthase [Candidatus Saccharimonadales bacterium]|nr:4-hydroxy-tetrahydrodipicolinate synthase [Candidatus Saccharimonadales bacterium]
MTNLSGCMTALVTPFDKELEVDYRGLRENVSFQIKNGVTGLVPLGTTGEAPTITEAETERVIEAVVAEASGRAPVIVGTGSNSTAKTIKNTRDAARLGASAALVVTPYYNRPSQEGVFRHFEAVAKASSIPVIVYNIASRTGTNIETQTLLRMSRIENIVGVKEASGSIVQMEDVIRQLPEDFIVLSGDDTMTLPLMALGGRGVISVVSNLLPKATSEMTRLALEGDFKSARKIHYRLLPIMRGAFMEGSPVPIKTAMALSGFPSGGVRLPLCELMLENLERLKAIVSKYDELKVSQHNH